MRKAIVFIDAANLELSVADLGSKPPLLKKIPRGYRWKAFPKGYWKVDYKKLIKYFKKEYALVEIAFYSARFNTRSHDDFLTFLKGVGYRLITKEVKRIRSANGEHRKANFDVEIAVDAVVRMSQYQTFILFSGDSDFSYLLGYLKKQGKRIEIISQRGHASRELIELAEKYFDVFEFRGQFLRPRKQKSR